MIVSIAVVAVVIVVVVVVDSIALAIICPFPPSSLLLIQYFT